MPDRSLRLLIAEKEYLIAIDARQILTGLIPCDVTITTMAEFRSALTQQPWDAVLIDVSANEETNHRMAREILDTGAALVFLTGHSDLADGVPGFKEWPVAIKPFTDRTLFDAVAAALARKTSEQTLNS